MRTQHIALALFLILVTVGLIILITVTILIKRRVARRKSRIERNRYAPCNYRLPKIHKESIERQVNATIRVRTEPRVFGTYYADNFEELLKNGNVTFLYRAKCMDDFLNLKRSILSVVDLEAPPMVDIRAFLMAARRRAMHPPIAKEQIEHYCQLYLRARHDIDAFTEEEYRRSSELNQILMKRVQQSRAIHVQASNTSDPVTSSSSGKLFRYSRIPPSIPPRTEVVGGDTLPEVHVSTRHPKTSVKGFGYTRCKEADFVPETVVPPVETAAMETVAIQNPFHESASSRRQSVPEGLIRRDSCRSDNSQTALIDVDPHLSSTKSPRFLRPAEGGVMLEMKPIVHRSKDTPGKSTGMANEAVNC